MQTVGFWTAAIVTVFVIVAFFWALITLIRFFIGLIFGGSMMDAFMAQYVVAGFFQFITLLVRLVGIVFSLSGIIIFIVLAFFAQIFGCI